MPPNAVVARARGAGSTGTGKSPKLLTSLQPVPTWLQACKGGILVLHVNYMLLSRHIDLPKERDLEHGGRVRMVGWAKADSGACNSHITV